MVEALDPSVQGWVGIKFWFRTGYMTDCFLELGWGVFLWKNLSHPPAGLPKNQQLTNTDWSRRRTKVRRVSNSGTGSGYLTHFANRWCPMNGDGEELWWGFDGRCTRIANEWTDVIGSSRRSNPNKTARVWGRNSLFLFCVAVATCVFRCEILWEGGQRLLQQQQQWLLLWSSAMSSRSVSRSSSACSMTAKSVSRFVFVVFSRPALPPFSSPPFLPCLPFYPVLVSTQKMLC